MEVTPAWACEVLCFYPFSWTTPWGEILAQISLDMHSGLLAFAAAAAAAAKSLQSF